MINIFSTADALSWQNNIEIIINTSMIRSPRVKYEEKPRVIFILGGPGSGKGTQSKLIQ